MLQQLNVLLVVRGSKLNTALEVWPHQCRVQGHDPLPAPAGHTIPDTSQDAAGLLGHLGTLLAHVQLTVDQHPKALFCPEAPCSWAHPPEGSRWIPSQSPACWPGSCRAVQRSGGGRVCPRGLSSEMRCSSSSVGIGWNSETAGGLQSALVCLSCHVFMRV